MSRILQRRPSPAMIVAFVALCVALAGTATALPGRSRVKKDDIARAAVRAKHIYQNAVRSKHIRARNVTRSKIAKRAVSSDLVGQDALTGQNIVESSLGTVPSASNASNSAKVNNRSVEKIAFVAPAGTGTTTVLNLNGLTITAACVPGPTLNVRAGTAVGGAFVHAGGTHTNGMAYYNEDDAFNPGDAFNPIDNALGNSTGDSNMRGTLVYVRPDGEVLTSDFMAEETATGCVFAGTAIG
jgi:hypothetical protein